MKVIGCASVGTDNVDLQVTTGQFGCLIVNALMANTIVAVEHGITLLAIMARNVEPTDASMKVSKNELLVSLSLSKFGLETNIKSKQQTHPYNIF